MNRELAAEVRRYLDTMGAMLEEQERAEAADENAAVAAADNATDSAQLELIPEPQPPGHADIPGDSD
jgi:hypothetical protein